MKKLLFVAALALTVGSMNSFAVSFVETTASPFITATRLLESTVAAPFLSTLATVQQRGVAGREQIKDEMVALNDDMISGAVKSIDDVRQPALKELFAEIASDEAQMDQINSVVTEGSELHKVATAVSYLMLAE
ncbi:hypothetical protein [uncultured Chryseobacterium sp.]|uniref:hypothetical protein n=1 Tax=uncultured Chryseobacterium sp. TaxID=259322 RepID=UPI0025877134|nr:hypothetical protein [uncultured Chryseobacterium sp.]